MHMTQMTPRERWLAYFNDKPVDRLPTDYWATAEFHQRFKADLGVSDDEALWRKLSIDRPAGISPRHLVSHHPHDASADMWGVRYASIDYGTGQYHEVSHSPLAAMTTVDEIDGYKWPTVEALDFSGIPEQVRALGSYRPIQGGYYEPFLLYCSLRGMEQAYEDLLLNPEIAHVILDHIFNYHYDALRGTLEAAGGKVDFTYIAEDLGSQTGPLIGLETYRTFLMPLQKKMADLARQHGVHIFYHTDGAAHIFLPDLTGVVGIEVLNPIQWRCPGMEREGLAANFGKKLIFHGAIDNQQTLPFGTPEDVRQEVRDCARMFKGCRWICGPCHNIQAVSPTANVVAMYEEASRLIWP